MGITSPASFRSTSHASPPARTPSDPPAMPRPLRAGRAWSARACRPPHSAGVRRARADTRAARLEPSAERRDLGEQIGLVHRLHDVITRSLAYSPDLVGFLAFTRAQDDGDVLGN